MLLQVYPMLIDVSFFRMLFLIQNPFQLTLHKYHLMQVQLPLLQIAAVSENEGFPKKNGAPFGDVWDFFFGGPCGDQMWPPPPFKNIKESYRIQKIHQESRCIGCWRDIFGKQSFVSLEKPVVRRYPPVGTDSYQQLSCQ